MKPTAALSKDLRRLALTTKKARKGFYKGTGTGSTGTHTKHGGFVIDYDKVRTYVVPPKLNEFKVCLQLQWGMWRELVLMIMGQLTPFVTKKIKAVPGKFKDAKGALSGKAYLKKWKRENGED